MTISGSVQPSKTTRARVVHSPAEVTELVAGMRRAGRTVALVPTMGALHDGHLQLVAEALRSADAVVVSIFVNPLQFAPDEDFAAYPRTLEADVAKLDAAGVDVVFAPSPADMYPEGEAQVRITGGPVAQTFEGAIRPTHFSGALTVVNKLMNIVGPQVAVFGRKDVQQLFLMQRMVADLNIPVEIHPVEIVRDDDGLAISSRNRYLSADERTSALLLSRALHAAVAAADAGPQAALGAAQAVFAGDSSVVLDYVAIVDESTFTPVADDFAGAGRMIVAARVGATRLIDNAALVFAAERAR